MFCNNLLFPLLIFGVFVSLGVSQSLSPSEKQILVDLWNQTSGSTWHYIDPAKSWNISLSNSTGRYVTQEDPCTLPWEGVTCNGTNVVVLNLTDHGLSGTIPNSFGGLTMLSKLYLNNNELSGSIENNMIKHLTYLKELDLSKNLLSGSVPILSNLTSLNTLALNGNQFSGFITRTLGKLHNLEFLDLSFNQLVGSVPSQISTMMSLVHFDLSNNHVSGVIPNALNSITKLQYINLQNNLIVGGISEGPFLKLSNIVTLDVSGNQLTGFDPAVFDDQKNITYLDLSHNSFDGPIPTLNTPKLEHLALNDNLWTGGIPDTIDDYSGLTYLNLHKTHMQGTIPQLFCNCTALVTIDMSTNLGLSGTIPSCFSRLSNVQFMDLSYTGLAGKIPQQISGMTSLVALTLSHSAFTGVLPSLGLGPSFKFGLGVEPRLGAQSGLGLGLLKSLKMDNNNFSSDVPAQFLWYMTNLDTLLLQNCSLTSDLNSWLAYRSDDNTQLRVLDLSFNNFHGTLPSTLFSFSALETIILSANCFSGTIPISICDATQLEVLVANGLTLGKSCLRYVFKQPSPFNFDAQLPTTKMTGSLPDCLYALPMLQQIHASGNLFPGNVQTIPVLSNLTVISLGNNILTGDIPDSVMKMGVKRPYGGVYDTLRLSKNRLRTGLNAFTLETQNLIPQGDGTFEVNVELDYNRLSGRIPSAFLQVNNLNMLEGNMFSCDDVGDGQVIPTQDHYSENYGCGSRPVNLGMIYFSVAVGICALMYLLASEKLFKIGGGKLVSAFEKITRWTTAASDRRMEEDAKAPHTFAYLRFLSRLRVFSMQVGLGIGVCLSICYAVMKAVWDAEGAAELAYINQYAWGPSAAFMIGDTAALVLLILWIITVGLVFYRLTVQMRSATMSSVAGEVDDEKKEVRSIGVLALVEIDASPRATLGQTCLFALIVIGIFITNIIMVTFVTWTYGFLLSSPSTTTTAKNAARAYMAGFYIMWNWWALPILHGLVRNAGPVDSIHKLSRSIFGSSLSFPCALLLFNNLFAPILSVLGTDQSCMKNLFYAAESIDLPFTYKSCLYWNGDGVCTTFGSTTEVSPYTPTFSYNYECASNVLQAYVPVFFITAIYDAFIRTLFVVFLRWLCTRIYGYSFGYDEVDEEEEKFQISAGVRRASVTKKNRRASALSGDGLDNTGTDFKKLGPNNERLRWFLMFFVPKKLWSQEEELSYNVFVGVQKKKAGWFFFGSKTGVENYQNSGTKSETSLSTPVKADSAGGTVGTQNDGPSQIHYVNGQLYLSKTIGTLFVLGTFGTAAPLLAIAIVFQLVLPLFLEEALLGRFLYEEIGRGHTAQAGEDIFLDTQTPSTTPVGTSRPRKLSGSGIFSPVGARNSPDHNPADPAGKSSVRSPSPLFQANTPENVNVNVVRSKQYASLFNKPHDPYHRLITLEQECKLSGIAEFLTGRWMVMFSTVFFLSGFLYDCAANKLGWRHSLIYPFFLVAISLFLECNLAVCIRCDFLPVWLAPPPLVDSAPAGENMKTDDGNGFDDGLVSLAALGTAPKDMFASTAFVYEDGTENGIGLGQVGRMQHNPVLKYGQKTNRDSF